ncbi:MAG TPA: glycosyltransferase family 9 protein [Candidatus Hydrogenedentes bacterium]|nr:glycosyltransferase family 9 protein [Candidatus Hydrogenedentota bacterium]
MTATAANRALAVATGLLGVLSRTGERDPVRRILVVRLGNLGDIVVALPAFHALRKRFPDARIVLLTSPTLRGAPGAEDVLADDPTFDDCIVYHADESGRPRFWRALCGRIRRESFDITIMLPDDRSRFRNLAKHMALLAVAGQRRFVGFRLVSPDQFRLGQVPRLMGLLEPLGITEIEPCPWIRVSEERRQTALRRFIPGDNRPLVAMQCGAKRPANRWMPERFVEVGRRLIEEHGVHILLTGGPGERTLADEVARGIGGHCTSLAGETSVTDLAILLERCVLLVSNDTGTMHVAAAMGVPVVAIFSARDHPFRWYPYGTHHCVLRHDVECSPCLQDVCPLYSEPVCLSAITAGQVFDAARALFLDWERRVR